MSKTRQSEITPQEAVQILQSALSYCQQAGISVLAENRNGTLLLTLPGVWVEFLDNGTRAEFRIGTPAENIGTSPIE